MCVGQLLWLESLIRRKKEQAETVKVSPLRSQTHISIHIVYLFILLVTSHMCLGMSGKERMP